MWVSFQIPRDGFPLLSIKILFAKFMLFREVKVPISALQSHCFPFYCVSFSIEYIPFLLNERLPYPRHPKQHPRKLSAISTIFLQNIQNELLWSFCLKSELGLFLMKTAHSSPMLAPLHSFLHHTSCSSVQCRAHLIIFVISQQMALQNRSLRQEGELPAGDLSWERAEAGKEMVKTCILMMSRPNLKTNYTS